MSDDEEGKKSYEEEKEIDEHFLIPSNNSRATPKKSLDNNSKGLSPITLENQLQSPFNEEEEEQYKQN